MHTNLDGQVLREGHPSLQEGCALTEELSAEELLLGEEQLPELEMTDSVGYGQ